MIAIVCGHICSTWFPGWLTSFWPVAFFFVVAGFYIKEEKLRRPLSFAGRKLKTIYLPGTVIYMLAVLMHNVFCRLGFYPLGMEHPMTHKPFALWDIKTELIQIVKTIFAPNGELVMGAMWFLYALFFALCFLSLIYYVTSKMKWDYIRSEWQNAAIIILLSSVSIGLGVNGYKIPRISNAITIVAFIYIGLMLKQRTSIRFENGIVCLIAIIIYAQYIILPHVHPSFPANRFPDIVMPMAMSISGLYIILYLAKKLAGSRAISNALSRIGRDSLYIMALHILGFFICTLILDTFSLSVGLDMAETLYTYNTGYNVFLLLLYLAFGICIPLAIISLYRIAKNRVMLLVK